MSSDYIQNKIKKGTEQIIQTTYYLTYRKCKNTNNLQEY